MNSSSPMVRATEMVASPLESFGGQPHSTETYTHARELRRWIAEHPDSESKAMPANFRGYIEFLIRKRLVTWTGAGSSRRYRVKPL